MNARGLLIFAVLAGAAAPAAAAGLYDEKAVAGFAREMEGRQAPAFDLKTLKGEKVGSGIFQDHWTVVMFGASWCPHTNKRLKAFEALRKDFEPRGVRFLIINVDDPDKKAAKWIRKRKIATTVVMDRDGKVAESYAASGLAHPKYPRKYLVVASTLVIGPDSGIRFYNLSGEHGEYDLDLGKLRSRLEALLRESASEPAAPASKN
ncbi:MAG: TlpA family protein disulfide reductase [Elusimicrobia bacterium]|nr:TlpA family protein disulfide reductase [Elusimicrobiota bacterium]